MSAFDAEYEPSPWGPIADEVARYEQSGGAEASELVGDQWIILWTLGAQSGKVRKTPLVRVADGDGRYAVIGSMHVVGLAMLLALYRLVRGPSVPDRILALDTLYVAAIAQLMLFGMYLGTAVYFEAALIIAMLGFVGTVVLSKYVLRRDIVE